MITNTTPARRASPSYTRAAEAIATLHAVQHDPEADPRERFVAQVHLEQLHRAAKPTAPFPKLTPELLRALEYVAAMEPSPDRAELSRWLATIPRPAAAPGAAPPAPDPTAVTRSPTTGTP